MTNGNLRALRECPICHSSKNTRCRISEDMDYLVCFNPPSFDIHTTIDLFGSHFWHSGKYILIKKNDSGSATFVHESSFIAPIKKDGDKRKSREYQKFPEKSSLFDQHYKELIRRGLSRDDIIRGRFRSLPDKYLDEHYCNGKGFDIPIWVGDEIGSYNYQTAWDNCNPKYSWAISGEMGKWDKRLMPLTYVNQDNCPNVEIFACEGILKPYLAYCLSGRQVPFLGASGGNFAASSDYLAQLIRKFKIESIVYCPDAGWRELKKSSPNQVFRTVNETLICFAKLGVEVKIADWGQGDLSKDEALDIDEWFQEWGVDAYTFLATVQIIEF